MTVVSDFFDAYERDYHRQSGGPALDPIERMLEEGAEKFWERKALLPPAIARAQLEAFLIATGFGVEGLDDYCELITTKSCVELELAGWVALWDSASEKGWMRRVRDASGPPLDAARFFPIGIDLPSDAGLLVCLDRGRGAPVISIEDEGRIFERVFSDFGSLLKVATRILGSEVVLHVERGCEPDAAQRALVRELRSIDPDGFGAIGWPRWYQRYVGGTSWGS